MNQSWIYFRGLNDIDDKYNNIGLKDSNVYKEIPVVGQILELLFNINNM